MDYLKIGQQDRKLFHQLLNAYYREGEDENTPQEEIDGFIDLLFSKVVSREIDGCFAMTDGTCAGFALWAKDTEDFPFSEIPGMGTILEIGLIPARRSSGLGKELVAFIESDLLARGITGCYVSAYGPAQKFWRHCGYAENGKTAGSGLPIMVKTIREAE